jgi:hypothetical protein
MSYPINYPTPQGANIQIFKEGGSTSSWVKPQGASFVWFTLIGAGGGGGGFTSGAGSGGGGSGAVTNCMVPAFLIPNQLNVNVGAGGLGGIGTGTTLGATGTLTTISYRSKAEYVLLTAAAGTGGDNLSVGSGGAASTSTYFSAMGFYQSVAGMDGSLTAITAPSATTFLSGGANDTVGVGTVIVANYGYDFVSTTSGVLDGIFQLQPIIVGVGGAARFAGPSSVAGNGCGGGGIGNNTIKAGNGGDGFVVIITW